MVGHGRPNNGKICFASEIHKLAAIRQEMSEFLIHLKCFDLPIRLKRWGMDSYVYAPKDDYKHRAYWREMYTVEEADHLTSMFDS